MNHKKLFGILGFIFVVALATFSCSESKMGQGGEAQSEKSDASPRKHLAKTEAEPWEDWLVLEGDQYVPVVDEVGRNFELARTSFLKMDFSTAAKEIRKAAAFLKGEGATGSKSEKERLHAVIRDLDQLAKQLDRHSVESLARMDEVFAKAHQVDMERNWAVVGFERWGRVARAPEAHFRLAEQALLKKDYDLAAKEIHRAAGLLKLEATRAPVEGQNTLNASWQELNNLAAEVKSGSVTSAQRLCHPFAAAGYALAESHYLKTIQDWTENDPKNSGHELEASILNLTEGAEWAGHGAEFDSSLVIKDAMALSKKLIDGELQTAKQISPEIRSVGNEIETLKKKNEPQA
jgi:hypothetical protein